LRDEWHVNRLGSFSDAVDEGLDVPGQSPKEAIYKFLESDYWRGKNEIPHRFREFSGILIDKIGPRISYVLEFIIKSFYSKLNLEVTASPTIEGTIETVERMLRRKLELSLVEDRLALPQ
jgi:hypothetical protein